MHNYKGLAFSVVHFVNKPQTSFESSCKKKNNSSP